jgi:hypothetical protein
MPAPPDQISARFFTYPQRHGQACRKDGPTAEKPWCPCRIGWICERPFSHRLRARGRLPILARKGLGSGYPFANLVRPNHALWETNFPSSLQNIEPPNAVLAEHSPDPSTTHETRLCGIATRTWHFFPNGQTSNPSTGATVGFGSMLTG